MSAWATRDLPTPPRHFVEKLVVAVPRPDAHRSSVSKGILRLRRATGDRYRNRYDVELDPDSEAMVTISSQEGIALSAVRTGLFLVSNQAHQSRPLSGPLNRAVFLRFGRQFETFGW